MQREPGREGPTKSEPNSFTGLGEHFGRTAEPDRADPPLCASLEAFAQGADYTDLCEGFQLQVEVLARLRVQERGVEGIHSRVTQALSTRRRSLGPAGIGLELKWPYIEDMLEASPEAWSSSLVNVDLRP